MSRRGLIGLLLVHGLMALVFAVTIGCSLPYAYPRISSIDSVDLVRLSGEVHAFRIDADGWIKDSAVEMQDYRLSPIPLDNEGRVPSQTTFSLEYGVRSIGTESHERKETHWTKVRLYRRGYRLIEIGPDRKNERVEWKPAMGVLAQEKAVDDLLWPPADERTPNSQKREKDKIWPGTLVGPGSLSPKQHEALLFVAGEYDRLILVWGANPYAAANPAKPADAANKPADAATKLRLAQKAKELRELAAR